MIEVVRSAACVTCDLCVKVCPRDVFDRGPDGVPVIARQGDCQTCFMCEAYCPTDALYVSPLSGPAPAGSVHADEDALVAAGAFGEYRRRIGWGGGRVPASRTDTNHLFTSRLRGAHLTTSRPTVRRTPPSRTSLELQTGDRGRPSLWSYDGSTRSSIRSDRVGPLLRC